MFCRFCVCFFFDICLPYVVSHVHRAGRGPAPYPCSFAVLPLSTLIFVVFAIRSAFWSRNNNNNNKTQHLLLVCNLSLFRRFAVASSSEMESIKKNANQFAAQLPPLHPRLCWKCSTQQVSTSAMWVTFVAAASAAFFSFDTASIIRWQ